jgi:hypothetical protein
LEFYVGLVFLLLTGATALAFPKLMGMLIDSEKIKAILMLIIALMLIGILLCNPFFLLDYPYLSILQNTL